MQAFLKLTTKTSHTRLKHPRHAVIGQCPASWVESKSGGVCAVWGVWGLQCLADIYQALGDVDKAAQTRRVHAAAVRDFNAVFWDGGAGQYHDWIDTAGKARSYFYVDIAFVAIIAGVANQSQSAALLRHYDTRLADIYADYKAACRAGLSPRDGV